jgi:hypothetical protein
MAAAVAKINERTITIADGRGNTLSIVNGDADAEPTPEPEAPSVQTFAQAAPELRQGEQGAALFSKAVALLVETRRLGTSRKVSSGAVETDADRSMIRVNKSTLDSPELKAIQQLDGEMRRFITSRCLPSMLKAGVYLVPFALVQQVDDEIERYATKRTEMIKLFLDAYEQRKTEAQTKLASMFDARDYPPIEDVARAFSVRTRYLSFDTPGALSDIKRSIFERERAKAEAEWSDALSECREILRVQMQELLDHAIERLTPGEDGKAKIFKESTIANLDSFLTLFEDRNITNDAQLSTIVQDVRRIMGGLSAADLRKDAASRASVAEQFAQAKALLDTMIGQRPDRQFSTIDE